MAPSPTPVKTKEVARPCLGPQPSRIRGSPALTGLAAARTAPRASPPLRVCASLRDALWPARWHGTEPSAATTMRDIAAAGYWPTSSAIALALLACGLCLRAALALRAACSSAVLRRQTVADRRDVARVAQNEKRDPPNSSTQTMQPESQPPLRSSSASGRGCGRGRRGCFFFTGRATRQARGRFAWGAEDFAGGWRFGSCRRWILGAGSRPSRSLASASCTDLSSAALFIVVLACGGGRAAGRQPVQAHGGEQRDQRYVRGDSTHVPSMLGSARIAPETRPP